jgi:hypothetical protein
MTVEKPEVDFTPIIARHQFITLANPDSTIKLSFHEQTELSLVTRNFALPSIFAFRPPEICILVIQR